MKEALKKVKAESSGEEYQSEEDSHIADMLAEEYGESEI